MKKSVLLVITCIVVFSSAFAWRTDDWDMGYVQIEQSSDIGVFDEEGNIVNFKQPLGHTPGVVIEEGHYYLLKVRLVNNGEAIEHGREGYYDTNDYVGGRIKILMEGNHSDERILGEFNNVNLKAGEIREFTVPIDTTLYGHLPDQYYRVFIYYYDTGYENHLKKKRPGDESELEYAWRQVTPYNSTDVNKEEKEKRMHSYFSEDYYVHVYFSHEAVQKKNKTYHYDPKTRTFEEKETSSISIPQDYVS